MATTTITVTADHPIPLPENFNYTNLSGGTLYYGNDATVSSSNNIGSVAVGASLTRRAFSYGIASAATQVLMSDAAASHETSPQKGLIHSSRGDITAGTAAGTYLLNPTSNTLASAGTQNAAAAAGMGAFYWSGQQFSSSGIPRMSVRGSIATNAVAPGTITFTFGLYPLTLSSTTTTAYTVGTVVTGSTAAIVNPGQSAATVQLSGDFTPPADGLYGIAVVTTASTAATSITALMGELFIRSV